MPGFVRLDPTDANFVDVIHTVDFVCMYFLNDGDKQDAESILMGGYGMVQPVGHVDFYPNGGEVQVFFTSFTTNWFYTTPGFCLNNCCTFEGATWLLSA